MVSKVEQEKKFDYASPGGFHVLLKAEQKDVEDFVSNDRKKVAFDWSQSEGYYEKLEDGRGQIAWILSDFDQDFFIESNKEEGILVPDWSAILDGVLDEAYYDVGFINPETQDEESVEMELVDFHIIGESVKGEEIVLSFTSEQIAYCNELAKKRFEPAAN